jgi:glycosyltransferase involved in cell wall biosynthesis
MRVLFLFPYPHNTAGSQRFRFEQYLPILKKEGVEYDLQAFIDDNTWEVLYKEGHRFRKVWGIIKGFLRRFKMLFKARQYDFIFIHREASPLGPPIFEWLLAKVLRKKIVFDFDDAIWLPNTSQENAWVAKIKFHHKTSLICKWAYKISSGNDYLADYARNFNNQVFINPTTIDTENWHNQTKNQAVADKNMVIGWTGTHSTLKYLLPLLPVIENLEKEFTFDFVVISDKEPDFQLKSFKYIPWNKDTEITDLLCFNIGVMPLTDDQWAKGKCGFKALQYMALGIPALVSPVGVNTQIVEHQQNGFICTSNQEWYHFLKLLLENESQRIEMGKNARQKIIDTYAVLANRTNFLGFFK